MLRIHGNHYDKMIAHINLLYAFCLAQSKSMYAGMCSCRYAQASGIPMLAETKENLVCPFCNQVIPDAVEILNGKERASPDFIRPI